MSFNSSITVVAGFIILAISVVLLWWHLVGGGTPQEEPNIEEAKVALISHETNLPVRSVGLGRPVRGRVLYSSKEMEQDEGDRHRILVIKAREELEAKKQAEEEELEAFKKKRFTMKDVPDFSFKIDEGDTSGLGSFI
ncbi:expressed unknown protein [Seminavis robusta]|uniref:Uncharacterized protein n=1 Tax=Seminavis robusta TaxID=568900 RepID=A0A9N8E2M1_9STRA|nr:expressed unknown protein [Seminavis robusta]|eukprot:Sro464_g148370.1 n/a (138) ;mRNA; r:34873-35286